MNNKQLKLLENSIFQDDLKNMAEQHHIEALIYRQLPLNTQLKQFKTKWVSQWHYTLSLRAELEKLGKIVQYDLQEKIIILKGMALLDEIYQDYGSRFMSDMDILIYKQDQEIVYKALIDLGYKRNKHKSWKGNHFKSEWIKSYNDFEINIEIHSSLFYHAPIAHLEFEPYSISPFLKLKLDDQIVHLCGHLVFQHTFLKMYWLMDLYFLVNTHFEVIDWDKVLCKAKLSKVHKSVQMLLWVLHKYFNIPLNVTVKNMFKVDRFKFWMIFINKEVLLDPNQSSINYWFIKHLSKDNIFEAFSYDFHWLLNKCPKISLKYK